ncbi:hypothetical protein CRENBAI_004035, partial [Crenichthys baileyi]
RREREREGVKGRQTRLHTSSTPCLTSDGRRGSSSNHLEWEKGCRVDLTDEEKKIREYHGRGGRGEERCEERMQARGGG